MGLFDKLFGRKEQLGTAKSIFQMLTGYAPMFSSWRGSIYESELVRGSIDALARHTSKMNVKIYGSAQRTLQTRLKTAPNEFQTWSQFLYRLRTILEVNTSAFIIPIVDDYDNTTGIFALLPSQTEFVQSEDGIPFVRYHFVTGQTAAIELSRCGILTKYQYQGDLTGDGNGALQSTMQLIDMQNQGIREGIKSAATYRFMAQLDNFAKMDDLVAERKLFSRENLSSDADGGGLLLFPSKYKNVQQIEPKPFVLDADQMKIIQTNVFNYFGVNEKVVQNNATPDELDAFFAGALEPFAIQLSEVLTKMLFTTREQASGACIVVTADRLQYMSVANKVSLIQTLGDRGMLTINEARQLLNYAPVPDGDTMMPIRGEYYNATEGDNEDGE